jgi:hypothetical protein
MSLKRKSNSGLNTRSILIIVIGGLLGGIFGALLALVPVWFSAQPAGDTGTMLFFVAVLATIFFAWMGIVFGGYLGWRIAR